MPEVASGQSLRERLKRRKAVQWGLAYLAGAWLLLQVIDVLGQNFGWSPVVFRLALSVAVPGFLVAMVLAWYHGDRGYQKVRRSEVLLLGGVLIVGSGSVGMAMRSPAVQTEDRADSSVAGEPPARSIAVLPFVNVGGGEDTEYLSDGITEELMNALSYVPGVLVAARTSSFSFKDRSVSIGEVARELNVLHVLEGSVRVAGDDLRVTARLADARSGYQLWSASYDRQLTHVLAVQEEIARSIIGALEVQLEDETRARIDRPRQIDVAAYTDYLKGSQLLNRASERSLRQAIVHLNRSLEREPSFVQAYPRIAHSWIRLGIFYMRPAEAFAAARAAAEKAVVMDPQLAEAYTALAFIATEYDWDWRMAESNFRRALDLAPGDAGAHGWYQNLLRILGRFDEALAHGQLSVQLDPLSAIRTQDLALTFYYWRRFDEAAQYYRHAVELDSAVPIIHLRHGMALSALGRHEEAINAAQNSLEAGGERAPVLLAGLGRILADAGMQDSARTLLGELQQRRAAGEHVDATYLAALYTGLGEFDRAFAELERAYDERSASLVSLRVHTWHDPLRDDLRYEALLRRMGLD